MCQELIKRSSDHNIRKEDTLFLHNFRSTLFQDGQIRQNGHHLTEEFSQIWLEICPESAHLHREITPPPYLVFGVGGVHPLAVSAGLQQDLDGVELQQDLAGHAVEEGDVGQSCRRQQENLAAGGALTQLCQGTVTHQDPVTAGNTSSCPKVFSACEALKRAGSVALTH